MVVKGKFLFLLFSLVLQRAEDAGDRIQLVELKPNNKLLNRYRTGTRKQTPPQKPDIGAAALSF